MLKNCVEWVIFDQAALALGLVTVPLYLDDRPESAAYILNDAGARLLLVEGKFQHKKLAEIVASTHTLQHIVSLAAPENGLANWSTRFVVAEDWLSGSGGHVCARTPSKCRSAGQHCLHLGYHGASQGRDADA